MVQIFLTGRIVRGLGVGVTLALLPGFSILGFAAMAAAPTLATLMPVQVLRRAGNFAIARPTREVLFTVLPREDRYKAKSFIDTFVYRLGDQVGAWSYAGLGAIGWGGSRAAMVAVPLSALWLVNALFLGRRQEAMAAEQTSQLAPELADTSVQFALPAPANPDDWRAVLGYPATLAQAESAYRARMRESHPDTGGQTTQAVLLNAAISEARRTMG